VTQSGNVTSRETALGSAQSVFHFHEIGFGTLQLTICDAVQLVLGVELRRHLGDFGII
jgi:hypothetical protein